MKEKGYKVQKVSVVTTLETFEFSNDPRSKANQETKVKEKKISIKKCEHLPPATQLTNNIERENLKITKQNHFPVIAPTLIF